MKELSIEEKSKRYDEAIERANKLNYVSDKDSLQRKTIEHILPELKENEDERIRKELIMMVKLSCTDGDDVDKKIAWLEKQGEQKQDPCDNCKDVMLNCHNFPCIKKRAFKQGKTVLEAIIDEKVDNANKVEQKFKDGDVLNSPSHHLIWIYKDNDHYHACVNMNYVTENVATDGLISIPNDACPATKEQRDTLMKAVADAGYAFDFKKKELRKINQKTTWSEEDERICQCLIRDQEEALDNARNSKYGHSEIIADLKETYRERIDWLKSFKERFAWKPSDEQMHYLSWIANVKLGDSVVEQEVSKHLNELLEELKKLK